MSQHAAELCVILVNEVYGELSSHVFGVLLRFGRLSLSSLAQNSGVPLRQLKHGLAVLIQQHLVFHYTAYNDEVTYYEADWYAAYSLVRTGKAVVLAEERHGPAASEVFSDIMLQGDITVGNLMKAYWTTNEADQLNGKNARDSLGQPVSGEKDTLGTFRSTSNRVDIADLKYGLQELLQNGLVSEVRADQFRPFTDSYNEAVRHVRSQDIEDGAKGSKANIKFELEVRNTLRSWRDGTYIPSKVSLPQGQKRKLNATEAGSIARRARYDKGIAEHNGYSVSDGCELELDEGLVVRINTEKYTVLSRNQELVKLAKSKIGSTPSRVYAELLNLLSKKIARCHDTLAEEDEEDHLDSLPSVPIRELVLSLDPDLDLASAVGKVPPNQVEHGSALRVGEDDEELDEEEWDEDEPGFEDSLLPPGSRTQDVKLQLRLLAQEPHRLVHFLENGKVTVDFRHLVRQLKETELEDVITSRFGTLALRLVRILLEKGKLDEKQISNLALVRQKDIRVTLTAMHQAGFLELQEVPRDNSRNASRTMFLWFFDPERCRQMVLEDMYKTMARLLQRAASEREYMRPLLDKAQRTDVVGKEEIYLSQEEQRALRATLEEEEKLLGQVMRLDRQVELLRDF